MVETATPAKRWNSFVCPACRAIFRVARDHDGRGVVCPSCRGMLRLPTEDAVPGPLMIPRAEEEEHEEGHGVTAGDDARGTLRLLAAMTVPALLLLGGFAWWLMPKDGGQAGGQDLARGTADSAAALKNGNSAAPEPAPARTMAVEVDSVARNFLEAKTVEEMLRWVRQPEQTAPKVEKWLAGGSYKAPGLSGTSGENRYREINGREVITVPVRTGDFEERDLILVREAAGLRADWESWVGWSEMSLAQFRKEKPQEPKVFRVMASESDYFNFYFKSEVEWKCYRLDSLDGEQSIFGYAARGTDLNSRLALLIPESHKTPFLLRLKFPPGARADNQVEITELVSENWVDLSAAPPPP